MKQMSDDEQWALMRSEVFAEELKAVREDGQKAAFYAMVRWHLMEVNARLKSARKQPRKDGWAAYVYKAHFGEWPDRAWENIRPMQPSDEVRAVIRRRENQWRRQVREKRDGERGVEDSEVTDAVQQGEEGIGAVCDGGRVCGLEEQDDGTGELRETDE